MKNLLEFCEKMLILVTKFTVCLRFLPFFGVFLFFRYRDVVKDEDGGVGLCVMCGFAFFWGII